MTDDQLADALAPVIGHRFARTALLRQALTHRSWSHEHPADPDNELLELIGDAVVDLCAVLLLARRFPDVREGELTNRRQHLVSTDFLGQVAAEVGIDDHIRLGRSEATKGKVERSIAGSAVEAIFAALFEERGFDACFALADRWLSPHIDKVVDGTRPAFAAKPPKNLLQELVQRDLRLEHLPSYHEKRHWGPDNDRWYECAVRVDGQEFLGEGRTKKEAETRAAALAWATLRRQRGLDG